MTGEKEKKKYNKGETSVIKYDVVKKNYHEDMELQQHIMEFCPNLEQDSGDLNTDAKLVHEQVPHEAKPDIKGKLLKMKEPVREALDKKFKKAPRYEMRPRKSQFSIDLNKPVTEEEHGLKDGSKVNTFIKPKVETDREMDENHQVQVMKQQIQSLQQQKQDLEMKHTKLQEKYQNLQKKHHKTCMFLKEII